MATTGCRVFCCSWLVPRCFLAALFATSTVCAADVSNLQTECDGAQTEAEPAVLFLTPVEAAGGFLTITIGAPPLLTSPADRVIEDINIDGEPGHVAIGASRPQGQSIRIERVAIRDAQIGIDHRNCASNSSEVI